MRSNQGCHASYFHRWHHLYGPRPRSPDRRNQVGTAQSGGFPCHKGLEVSGKMLPLVGTLPLLRISSGLILTSASSGKALKLLKAWFARMFLSARNRMRGLREPSRFKFQRV